MRLTKSKLISREHIHLHTMPYLSPSDIKFIGLGRFNLIKNVMIKNINNLG